MTSYYLVDYYMNGDIFIIGTVLAKNIEAASTYFCEKGLVFGELITRDEFIKYKQDQSDLNALESQSPEC